MSQFRCQCLQGFSRTFLALLCPCNTCYSWHMETGQQVICIHQTTKTIPAPPSAPLSSMAVVAAELVPPQPV